MATVPFLLKASPSDVLEVGGRDLAPLLSPRARARLLKGVDKVPLPARTLCLECRLDDDERVDLALCLATHTAGLVPALESLANDYADDPEWQRCLRLLLTWARSEDRTLAAVPFLYTAFDLGTAVPNLPVPCLSLCADPSFFMQRLGLPAPRAPRDFVLRLLDSCRDLLDADWVSEPLREQARGCVEAVEDLEVRQLSLMLGRRPATLKLDVTLPVADLGAFLTETAWQGSDVELGLQLRRLAPWQRRVQLNYVISATPQQTPLEVELCCTGPDEATMPERAQLLEQLVATGLADAAKARALIELVKSPAAVDTHGRWVGRNWYLKLRWEGERFVSAKAYIGLMQRSDGASLPTTIQPGQGQ